MTYCCTGVSKEHRKMTGRRVLGRFCSPVVWGLSLIVTMQLFGCGPSQIPLDENGVQPNLQLIPLTKEIWIDSKDPEKFSPEVLQKLKRDDPTLKTQSKWKEFKDNILGPAFEKEVGKPYTGKL